MPEITLAEAGRRLGLSPSTVKHQAQAGRIRARKVGNLWLVTEREVERYRTESLGQPGRPAKPEPRTRKRKA